MAKGLMRVLSGLVLLVGSFALALDFPGPPPGPATGSASHSEGVLENSVLEVRWSFAGGASQARIFYQQAIGNET